MKHALEVLEWGRIAGQLAQHCETAQGSGLALALVPSLDVASMKVRVAETTEAWDLYATQLPSLRGIFDVGTHVEAAAKGRTLPGEVLAQAGRSIRVMAEAGKALSQKDLPRIGAIAEGLADLPGLGAKLERSLDLDGYVRDEASAALASARAKRAQSAQRALQRIQSYATGKTRDLLSDPIYTERNGRYVVPLKAENRGKIRGIVHDSSSSGQTIFVEPDDVVALGNAVREAEAAERAETERVLRELSEEVGSHADEICQGFEAAAALDLVFAKARFGAQSRGCLPVVVDRPSILIKNGRHPLLDPQAAVPMSIELGGEAKAVLITGPNTGGKTVAIKTVGLTAVMAQCGLMPPAHEVQAGCFTQFWADIGDEQSLEQSLSTFSAHIKNISDAMSQVKPGSLVLLDEIGAGTDPDEGAALAVALLKEFSARGAVLLASTHYGEIKLFASNWPGFMNASMEFDVKSLRPTYRFLPGMPGSSHAFKIAVRYGIPQSIVNEAKAGFSDTEQDIARLIEELEAAQRQARASQSEADRLAAHLKTVEAEAKTKIERAEQAKRNLTERSSAEIDELLRSLRVEAASILETLRVADSPAAVSDARLRLKHFQEAGSSLANEVRPPKVEPKAVGSLSVGVKVQDNQTGLKGIVVAIKGDEVTVSSGAFTLGRKASEVTVIGAAPPVPPRKKSASPSLRSHKAGTISTELHLRHMKAEDAEHELDKYLDDALVAGVAKVRIVHGKGSGVLRELTRRVLDRHRDVKDFKEADADEGGAGVTVAWLK